MKKNWIVTVTHAVIFLDGNPHGGPDAVSYASLASAVRSARQERDRGNRVQVREIKPLLPEDRRLTFGPAIPF